MAGLNTLRRLRRGELQLSPPARTIATRVLMGVLALLTLDGALTWFVTHEAADVIAEIEERDGVVSIDDSELGATQQAEIERTSGSNSGRIQQARIKWIPMALLALASLLFVSRADPALQNGLVMTVAVTLAVIVAPRVVYSSELRILDAVFG